MHERPLKLQYIYSVTIYCNKMAQPPGLHVRLKIPNTNIWTQPNRVTTKSVINTKGSPTTVQIIFERLLFLGKKISESIKSSVTIARVGHMQEDAKESTEQKFKTIIKSVQKEKEKLESEMEKGALDLDCNSLLIFLNGKYNIKALIQAFFDKYDDENNEESRLLDDIDYAKAIFDLLYNNAIKYEEDLPRVFAEGERKGQSLTDEERREFLCKYINNHFENDSYKYSENYKIKPTQKTLGDIVKIGTKVGFYAPYFDAPWHPGQIYHSPVKKTESGYEEYPVKLVTGIVVGVKELDPTMDSFTHATYIPIEVNVKLDDSGDVFAFPSSRLYDLSKPRNDRTTRRRSPDRKPIRSRSRSRNNSPNERRTRSRSNSQTERRSRSRSRGG